MEFNKNDIPEMISVRSIRTVYDIVLDGKMPIGESHDFPELIYVYRGEHVILIDDKRVKLCAGQMTVYAPMAYHIGEAPVNASIYIISFDSDSDTLKELYSRPITLTAEQSKLLEDIVFSAIPLFENIPKGERFHGMRKKEGVCDLEFQKLKNRFELFLLEICNKTNALSNKSAKTSKDILLERICEYLKQNLDKNFSLDDIAHKFHIGKSSLTLLFREKYKIGLIAYFNRAKVEKAKLMINENKMNFTEISESLGFSSIHYFSRTFKNIEGMSPSQYKRQLTKF